MNNRGFDVSVYWSIISMYAGYVVNISHKDLPTKVFPAGKDSTLEGANKVARTSIDTTITINNF